VTTGQAATAAVRGIIQGNRLAWLALLAPLGLLTERLRKWRATLLLLAATLLLLPAGCDLGVTPGSGAGGSGSTGSASGTTPSGVYSITLTGASPGLSHSVQVTLTVE
jgi:hypothetical protein